MKTALRWLAENVYSLKGVTENSVRDIQVDALLWASDQIVEDGNPAVVKDKILREIHRLKTQQIIAPTPEQSSAVQSVR